MIAAALTAVVVLAAAIGAGAANAPSQSYQVTGLATVTPQGTTTSLFGFATGSAGDRGIWRASVTNAPLAGCSSLGSSCAITGGTFGLNSNNGSQVAGPVTGGSVTLTAQAPGCGRQQYTVNGSAATGAGDVTFSVVLTQFRLSFRGTCFAFPGSTIAGSLTVDPFPKGEG
jgi:hypothetical protein